MSWYKRDYNPEEDSNGGGGGGNGGSGGGRPTGPMLFRIRLPYGMDAGRDVLYLGDDPFRFWEHNGKDPESGKWTKYGVCLVKSGIADVCPVCDKMGKDVPLNLYNVGMFSGIDLSFAVGKEYRGERRMYLCEKRLVPAKRGSKDYPGALADLMRIREREGRLRGLVIHQIRKGKKSATIGDSFEVVERLDPTESAMREYLKERVRKMIRSGYIGRICSEKGVGLPSAGFYQDKIMGLNLEEADYERIFRPMSAVELANHFGLAWTPPRQQGMFDGGGDDPFSGEDTGSGGDPFNYDDPDGTKPSGNENGSEEEMGDMPF